MFIKSFFSKALLISAVAVYASTCFAQISNGRYVIVNQHSGKALDVSARSQDDGANIIQWTYGGGTNQQWDVNNLGNGYYSIRAAHSGKSIDVFEWNTNDGADARQWSWLNGTNQHWAIDNVGNNTFAITSRFSAKALEVFEFNTANGGDIRLWTYWSGANQLWRFDSVSSGGGGDSGSITGATCNSTGSTPVSSTIRVTSGTYDGGCQTFNPTSALGDGSQNESQQPAFRVENGATLRNVIIGNNGVDGIHVYNGGTLDNIRWTNVGEDAMTIKSSGTVTVRNISGYNGEDKFFQINAASTLNVSNCVIDNMGKTLRQNGGTTYKITVNLDRCQISNMGEGIFRTDSSASVARITNSRLRNAGSICIGPWSSCTSSGITNY
jgi:pectate lyase C